MYLSHMHCGNMECSHIIIFPSITCSLAMSNIFYTHILAAECIQFLLESAIFSQFATKGLTKKSENHVSYSVQV